MIPVLNLLLAVLCLLVGLAAGLHLTAASKWRLLRDFLYLLVVFVVAAGLAIPSYILWQPAPPPLELVPAAKWRYVAPALCLLWLLGGAWLRHRDGRQPTEAPRTSRAARWPRKRILGSFGG